MYGLKHKFNAVRTEVDNIKFASKKEARRYLELKSLEKAGEVKCFTRQVPWYLEGGTKWVCDFLVFWKDGICTVEDVKGFKTPEYKIKKREIETKYPFTITEI